jgi:hypothetical protein
MPRQYTQHAIMPQQITNAGFVNSEFNVVTTEMNGLLDQNNMPLESVDKTKVAPPVYSDEYQSPTAPAHNVKHTYMQSQSYHTSRFCGPDGEVTNPISTISQDDWQLGWIKLSLFRNESDFFPGAALTFDAKEGMIVGEAQVDCDWRVSYVLRQYQQTPTTDSVYLYEEYFIEWGVFINDVCCGRTDEQWGAGRFTYVLPFSTPIGSSPCDVDIRFRIIWKNNPYPGGASVEEVVETPLVIHDSLLWVRNQYR